MMALRPQLDPYHSLPTTPLGIDPRTLTSLDIVTAMNHARAGLEAQDYFSGNPRSTRTTSPYPHGSESESRYPVNSIYSAEGNSANLAGFVCRYVV